MNPVTAACPISPWRRRGVEVASIAIFLGCIAAVARHTRLEADHGDAEVYHDAVRKAVDAMPRELAEWVGVDVPIPAQAESLLRPTAFLSRRYVNRATGESCVVALVHCGDAHNMLDHYPPNCYPGQGWSLQSSVPVDFDLSFGPLRATNYEFSRGRFGESTWAAVTNSMLMPDGTTNRDMAGLERAVGASSMRYYGAAQVQVFFDQAISAGRRQEIAKQMLEGHRPCILTIVRQPRLR